MTHNKAENRIGRFRLSHEDLRRDWHNLLPVFGNFVIVQIIPRWDRSENEYVAYSPLFEIIPEICDAPEYELEIAMMPDGPAVIKAHCKP